MEVDIWERTLQEFHCVSDCCMKCVPRCYLILWYSPEHKMLDVKIIAVKQRCYELLFLLKQPISNRLLKIVILMHFYVRRSLGVKLQGQLLQLGWDRNENQSLPLCFVRMSNLENRPILKLRCNVFASIKCVITTLVAATGKGEVIHRNGSCIFFSLNYF